MDIFLIITIITFIFSVLLYASIRDIQTRQVSNWIWILGLFGSPFVIYRMTVAGLLFPYVLQALLVFVVAFGAFQVGFLGGADGKALLIISLTYPWIILNFVWLLLAPFLVVFGSFLLLGIHSLIVLLQNLITRRQYVSRSSEGLTPKKRLFWVIRRLKKQTDVARSLDWEPVIVPLIVYFLISYFFLLLLSTGPVLILG